MTNDDGSRGSDTSEDEAIRAELVDPGQASLDEGIPSINEMLPALLPMQDLRGSPRSERPSPLHLSALDPGLPQMLREGAHAEPITEEREGNINLRPGPTIVDEAQQRAEDKARQRFEDKARQRFEDKERQQISERDLLRSFGDDPRAQLLKYYWKEANPEDDHIPDEVLVALRDSPLLRFWKPAVEDILAGVSPWGDEPDSAVPEPFIGNIGELQLMLLQRVSALGGHPSRIARFIARDVAAHVSRVENSPGFSRVDLTDMVLLLANEARGPFRQSFTEELVRSLRGFIEPELPHDIGWLVTLGAIGDLCSSNPQSILLSLTYYHEVITEWTALAQSGESSVTQATDLVSMAANNYCGRIAAYLQNQSPTSRVSPEVGALLMPVMSLAAGLTTTTDQEIPALESIWTAPDFWTSPTYRVLWELLIGWNNVPMAFHGKGSHEVQAFSSCLSALSRMALMRDFREIPAAFFNAGVDLIRASRERDIQALVTARVLINALGFYHGLMTSRGSQTEARKLFLNDSTGQLSCLVNLFGAASAAYRKGLVTRNIQTALELLVEPVGQLFANLSKNAPQNVLSDIYRVQSSSEALGLSIGSPPPGEELPVAALADATKMVIEAALEDISEEKVQVPPTPTVAWYAIVILRVFPRSLFDTPEEQQSFFDGFRSMMSPMLEILADPLGEFVRYVNQWETTGPLPVQAGILGQVEWETLWKGRLVEVDALSAVLRGLETST
ncbi:MAG: hypothetical protein H6739_32755 [Alphaproteobacteria bacterium]|nr:hypothetical protein [Alphaproteobacteria bacterium]